MRWYQFVKALRSEFGEDGHEKPSRSVDSDPTFDSVCEEAIEAFQSNSSNFSLLSKSILTVQSVDTIGNFAIQLPTISVSDIADANDQYSLQASGDNRPVAPAVSVRFARVRDSVVHDNAYNIISELDDFVAKIDVPIAWQLYASNGSSKGLNQICCCSELNVWYAGRGYAPQCEACIANSDLELVAVGYSSQHSKELGAAAFCLNTPLSSSAVSNCLSSGKASPAANISHVSKEFCMGYGIVTIDVKCYNAIFIPELLEQMIRTRSMFNATVHISLKDSQLANANHVTATHFFSAFKGFHDSKAPRPLQRALLLLLYDTSSVQANYLGDAHPLLVVFSLRNIYMLLLYELHKCTQQNNLLLLCWLEQFLPILWPPLLFLMHNYLIGVHHQFRVIWLVFYNFWCSKQNCGIHWEYMSRGWWLVKAALGYIQETKNKQVNFCGWHPCSRITFTQSISWLLQGLSTNSLDVDNLMDISLGYNRSPIFSLPHSKLVLSLIVVLIRTRCRYMFQKCARFKDIKVWGFVSTMGCEKNIPVIWVMLGLKQRTLALAETFTGKEYVLAQGMTYNIATLLTPQCGFYYDIWVARKKFMTADHFEVINVSGFVVTSDFDGKPQLCGDNTMADLLNKCSE